MSENTNAVAKTDVQAPVMAGFGNSLAFDFMQRQAQMLASSALVPKEFSLADAKSPQEKAVKIANVVIALEMANRIGASPLSVMQNLYIVHGKPSWSSTFIIAAINGCGRFSAMRFEMTGTGDGRTCVAVATEKATGERLESPPVSIEMAKAEGWFSKAGSKWKTMPELMLRYRCATLFGRLYAPEILMGMRSAEELEDIDDAATVPAKQGKAADIAGRFADDAPVVEAAQVEPQIEPKSEPDVSPDPVAENPAPAENTDLLQRVYAELHNLFESTGEMPDDICDRLTAGKYGCQVALESAPANYLSDLLLTLKTCGGWSRVGNPAPGLKG